MIYYAPILILDGKCAILKYLDFNLVDSFQIQYIDFPHLNLYIDLNKAVLKMRKHQVIGKFEIHKKDDEYIAIYLGIVNVLIQNLSDTNAIINYYYVNGIPNDLEWKNLINLKTNSHSMDLILQRDSSLLWDCVFNLTDSSFLLKWAIEYNDLSLVSLVNDSESAKNWIINFPQFTESLCEYVMNEHVLEIFYLVNDSVKNKLISNINKTHLKIKLAIEHTSYKNQIMSTLNENDILEWINYWPDDLTKLIYIIRDENISFKIGMKYVDYKDNLKKYISDIDLIERWITKYPNDLNYYQIRKLI